MLKELTIHNFGLIDKVSIEFDARLNILTGETGAGKSILIDALRCVLGERMDNSSIRDPKLPCFIEAVFEIHDKKLLNIEEISEYLTAQDPTLIIQRTQSADGKSKIKINGLTVTVGQLKNIGNVLIDFHGPHDHQMLLAEDQHIKMLDQLVDFKLTRNDYTSAFRAYEQTRHQITTLQNLSANRQRDLDLLTHQVKELESVPLSEDKYNELQQAQIKINNTTKLNEQIQSLLGFMDDDEHGANALLRKSFTPLKALTHIDEKSSPLLDQLSAIQEQTNDLISQLTTYADSLEFDPQTADEINNKYDAYHDIKRKYGPTLADANAFYIEAKGKLDLIKNFEHNDQQLRDTLAAQEKELTKIAQKMTKARQNAAQDLTVTIESELKELGINHVKFEVRFEKISYTNTGCDKAVFYISPNAGEELKPLAQIVSSGEAARVMLALKKALINVDPVPVLIFDEIDAQIGGRLGTITGQKLKQLSCHRQVILITHLPQIASFANRHLKVIKSVKNQRALTDVLVLDDKQRVDEIAQMMSGVTLSKTALAHAQDMLATAKTSP